MTSDIFGDLREWGCVLEQISQLAKNGKLGEHQEGLARILRYRENWRLREEVLKAVGGLESPSRELLSAILDIASDDRLYFEVRILAIQAVERMIANTTGYQGRTCTVKQSAVERLTAIRDSGPPVFRDALQKCLRAIRSAQ